MKFLKYYSLVVVTISVVLCLFAGDSGDGSEILGGIIFLPVVAYLWILATDKK